jgi:hypothetical protein
MRVSAALPPLFAVAEKTAGTVTPFTLASTTLLSYPGSVPRVRIASARPSLSVSAVMESTPSMFPPPSRTLNVTGTCSSRL